MDNNYNIVKEKNSLLYYEPNSISNSRDAKILNSLEPHYDSLNVSNNTIDEHQIVKSYEKEFLKQLIYRNHSGKASIKSVKLMELSPQKQLPKSAMQRPFIKKKGGFQKVAELIFEKNDKLLLSYAEEMVRKKTGQIIKVKRNQKVIDLFSENENLDDLIREKEKEKNKFNLEEYQKKLVIYLLKSIVRSNDL